MYVHRNNAVCVGVFVSPTRSPRLSNDIEVGKGGGQGTGGVRLYFFLTYEMHPGIFPSPRCKFCYKMKCISGLIYNCIA